MDNTIFTTILDSLLDELVSVFFAGVLVWCWQNKYSERKNRIKILFERRCKEEELFYDNFRKAKTRLYELFVALTNLNEIKTESQIQINDIVSDIQKCINQIKISNVVLGKYSLSINNISEKYNKFNELYSTYIMQQNVLSDEKITEVNDELMNLKNEIIVEIENVDNVYFYKRL